MDKILFDLGPITVYWYSVAMLLAVLTGIYLAFKESKKQGMYKFISDLVTYVIIFGIIGARIYYVLFNFDNYQEDLLSIFKIWEGGIAIYGAIIGGLLTIIYFAKKKKQSVIKTLDIIVPGLILAQAIGRWGNFFNQEAYGTAVSLDFLQSLYIPNFIIEGMYIDGVYHHPTFLYESIWCILGYIFLVIIRIITKRKQGIMVCSYFIWYGIGRLFIEGLRTDSLYLGSFRISQIVSMVLIIIGLLGIIINFMKGNKDERKI